MGKETHEAIVLRTVKYGEHDKMLTLLTKDAGKLSAVAKGAQSAKSRYLASCQLFCRSEFVLSTSISGIPYVSGANVLSGYYDLKNDLERLAAASYCAELSDMLLEEGMGEGALYQLLGYTFLLLEKTTLSGVWTSTLAFVLKLLGLTGVYPILDKCAVCGKQAPRYYFDFSAGGLICGNCRDRDVVCPAISDKEASFLYGLLHLELKKLGELHSPEKKTQKYLLHQLNEYISYQYLKKSRSFGLLYSL